MHRSGLRLFAGLSTIAIPLLFAAGCATAQSVEVRVFHAASEISQHPQAEIAVPPGYKIISGGARVVWSGAGNLLTASYPDGNRWIASSKDYDVPSPATIEVWAIALADPKDDWDVVTRSNTSTTDRRPYIEVALPVGYALTGGGAKTTYSGAGSLLTCMGFHDSTWFAVASDHTQPDPATVTAYAIGVKPRNGDSLPILQISSAVSDEAEHPDLSLGAKGALVVGGGACTRATGAGDNAPSHNYLTASFPSPDLRSWNAAAKDHEIPYPTNLAIMILAMPALKLMP